MRIAIGSDHAGFDLKAALGKHLAGAGHQVIDLGTDSPDVSVDYPVFGLAVARAVAAGRVERGVCVCGTGIGIGIAANKVDGVRAALVHDVTTAYEGGRHQKRLDEISEYESSRAEPARTTGGGTGDEHERQPSS